MGAEKLTTTPGLDTDATSGGEAGGVFGNDAENGAENPGNRYAGNGRKSDVVPRASTEVRALRDIQPMRQPLAGDVQVFVHEINQQLAVASMTESALSRLAAKAALSEDQVDPEQVKSLLSPLKSSLETMIGLVRELRDSTRNRVEQTAAVVDEMKDIHISDFLNNLVQGWHELFDDHAKITSDISPGLSVLGNKRALHEILHNIFINAVEICEKRGGAFPQIHIQARVFRDLVQIIVQDNGPGITMDEKLKLLTPGFTTKGGHGIGLIRCNQLIEAMDGNWDIMNNTDCDDIDDDCRPSKGASFVIEIPILKKT
ncbi:HAMP domain-containing histidine kinase [Candidatus Peregrinibacteria bacterium]|nr:HAMP domain-containing histidine kinase [Candidatus Peregrinibacteria bacterium]